MLMLHLPRPPHHYSQGILYFRTFWFVLLLSSHYISCACVINLIWFLKLLNKNIKTCTKKNSYIVDNLVMAGKTEAKLRCLTLYEQYKIREKWKALVCRNDQTALNMVNHLINLLQQNFKHSSCLGCKLPMGRSIPPIPSRTYIRMPTWIPADSQTSGRREFHYKLKILQ